MCDVLICFDMFIEMVPMGAYYFIILSTCFPPPFQQMLASVDLLSKLTHSTMVASANGGDDDNGRTPMLHI